MAWIVREYVGVRLAGRLWGFTSHAAALAYLLDIARGAAEDGFEVDGDPLDGVVAIGEPGHGQHTYVMSETSDARLLRRSRPAATVRPSGRLP